MALLAEPEMPRCASLTVPKLWRSGGEAKPYEHEVPPESPELNGVVDYFMQNGGVGIPGVRILRATRNENKEMYVRYHAYRESLPHGGNEKWLWHGTRNRQEIVTEGDGLLTAFASADFNALGIANYFARDPRVPDYFAGGRGVEPVQGEVRTMLWPLRGGSRRREP